MDAQINTNERKGIKIGIKVLCVLLMIATFNIGMDMIFLFFGNIWLALITLIVFVFTNRTFLSAYKLKKKSLNTTYVAIALLSFYVSIPAVSFSLLSGKLPTETSVYVNILLLTVVVFVIISSIFFFLTRKNKDLFTD